jgi:predicted cupin superfamily sugar epimerase
MHPRAEELIRELRLEKHPEGGHFSEVFRSPRLVRATDAGGAAGRSALTTIYFLLVEGEASHWHRLDADEIWHFYEGAPLELFLFDAAAGILTRTRLGPAASGTAPVHVVPAGAWVAARPAGDFALVGCTMGPGFEAAGFTLLKDMPDVAVDVARRFPEVAEWL